MDTKISIIIALILLLGAGGIVINYFFSEQELDDCQNYRPPDFVECWPSQVPPPSESQVPPPSEDPIQFDVILNPPRETKVMKEQTVTFDGMIQPIKQDVKIGVNILDESGAAVYRCSFGQTYTNSDGSFSVDLNVGSTCQGTVSVVAFIIDEPNGVDPPKSRYYTIEILSA